MSIQCLPTDLISYVGEHMDQKSRVNANIASKAFQTVHTNTKHYTIWLTEREQVIKLNKQLVSLNKLAPHLQSLQISFNSKNVEFFDEDMFLALHAFKSVLYISFNECTIEFINKILTHINYPIYSLQLRFENDYTNIFHVRKLINNINIYCKNALIHLTIVDSPSIYIMLHNMMLASRICTLEMYVSMYSSINVEINLDHIEMHEFITKVALEVESMQRIRKISSIDKVTALHLHNASSHYTCVVDALSKNKNKKVLKTLTLTNPYITYAHDTDSVIYRLLSDCYNELLTLRLTHVPDRDLVAFVDLLFTRLKFKKLELQVENEQDTLCARVLQLVYPNHDIDVLTREGYKHILAIDDMNELYDKMNDVTKWRWHWVTLGHFATPKLNT